MKIQFRLFLKIIFYILVEVFGAVLLVSFFSMIMEVSRVLKLVPWIVALSSAASGYGTLDKGIFPRKYRHVAAAGAGSTEALLLYGVLSVFLFFSIGERPFTHWDLLIFLVIGSGCGEIGGLLAMRKGVSPG